jgi:hypothetical protein
MKGMRQGNEGSLITTAGFTDNDGVFGQRFEKDRNGFFVVENTNDFVVAMNVEVEFGDIDADVSFHLCMEWF